MKNKERTIDIWGCCVSRDCISIGGDDSGFKIGVYAQGCSPLVQFTPHICPTFTLDSFEGCANFLKKCFCYDSNKTLLDELNNSDSDWILVDLRTMSYGLLKIDLGSNCTEYITYDRPDIKKKAYQNAGIKNIVKLEYNDFSYEKYFDEFTSFLKRRYGNNIILLEVLESACLQNSNGKVTIDSIQLKKIEFESKLNLEFIKKTNCYTIKCPNYLPADCYHRWGFEPVHFVEEYYQYVYSCLCLIIDSPNNLVQLMDQLYYEYQYKFIRINTGAYYSIRNTIKRIELNATADANLSRQLIQKLIDQGSTEVYGVIGRAYRDGTLYPKNIDLAIENMRIAAEGNIFWAKPELFDLLWIKGTEESYKEMCKIAEKGVKLGDANCMVRLARAYREGKGVTKDVSRCIDLLKQATKVKGWAFKCLNSFSELFDVYQSLNDTQYYNAMVEISNEGINSGDVKSYIRLARLYRDGKGVTKDISKAIQLMRVALNKGESIAPELFDLLWMSGTQEDYKEMVRIISPDANKLRPDALMRLARAYRDGRGVPRDTARSKELMTKAINIVDNVNWEHELLALKQNE